MTTESGLARIRTIFSPSGPWVWAACYFGALAIDFPHNLTEQVEGSARIDARIALPQVIVFFVRPIFLLLLAETSLVQFKAERRAMSRGAHVDWPVVILWLFVAGITVLTGLFSSIVDLVVVAAAVYIDQRYRKTLVVSFWAVTLLLSFKVISAADLAATGSRSGKETVWVLTSYFVLAALIVGIAIVLSWLHRSKRDDAAPPRIRILRFQYLTVALGTGALLSAITCVVYGWLGRCGYFPERIALSQSSFVYWWVGGWGYFEPSAFVPFAALRAGASWVAAMPHVVLALLLYQQVLSTPVRSWRHYNLRALHTEDVERRLTIFDHLSTATSSVVALLRKHGFRVVVGGSLNIALSLVPLLRDSDSAIVAIARSLGVSGSTSTVSFVIYVNLWLTSAIMWLGPFVESLIAYTETRREALSLRIRRELAHVTNHFVVCGFGDVGKRVVELMHSDVKLRRHLMTEARETYLPDGERVRVLPRLLVVDKDPNAFAFLDKAGALSIGLVRVSSMWIPSGAKGVEVHDYAPTCALGICGDVNNAQILEEMRLDRAIHYSCLVRDDKAAYSSTDHILATHGLRARYCIVSVPSTASLEYFSANSVRTRVSYLYLEQLRTLGIAQALAATHRGLGGGILFVGSGKEIAFVVDALWRLLPERSRSQLSGSLALLTNDDYYLKRFGTVDGTGALNRRVDLYLLRYKPVGKGESGRVEIRVSDGRLAIPGEIEKVIDAAKPTVIVTTDPDAVRHLVVLRGVIDGVRRATPRGMPPPVLLIATETGELGRVRNVADAGLYYAALWSGYYRERRGFRAPLGRYPGPWMIAGRPLSTSIGDLAIDVIDDVAHRITGIIRAHFAASGSAPATAVEVSMCLHNQPTALASMCSALAGKKGLRSHPNDRGRWSALLQGTSIVHDSGSTFLVRGMAHLVELKRTDGNGEGGITGASSAIQRALIVPTMEPVLGDVSTRRHQERERSRMLVKLKRSLLLRPGRPRNMCDGCPDMLGCPIAGFRVHVDAASEFVGGPPMPFTPAHPHRRYLFGSASSPPDPINTDGQPLARVVVLGTESDEVGSLATLLAALNCETLAERESKPDYLINISHYSEYPCHNPAFALASITGNIKSPPSPARAGVMLPSQLRRLGYEPFSILCIRVTSGRRQWWQYARNLLRFLTKRYSGDVPWTLEYAGERRRSFLLVIHRMREWTIRDLYAIWDRRTYKQHPDFLALLEEEPGMLALMREIDAAGGKRLAFRSIQRRYRASDRSAETRMARAARTEASESSS